MLSVRSSATPLGTSFGGNLVLWSIIYSIYLYRNGPGRNCTPAHRRTEEQKNRRLRPAFWGRRVKVRSYSRGKTLSRIQQAFLHVRDRDINRTLLPSTRVPGQVLPVRMVESDLKTCRNLRVVTSRVSGYQGSRLYCGTPVHYPSKKSGQRICIVEC